MINLPTSPDKAYLAHFIEHLAFSQNFNRTQLFQGNQIVAHTSPFSLKITSDMFQNKILSNIYNFSYFDYILELPQIKFEMSQLTPTQLAQERNLQQAIGGHDIAFPSKFQLLKNYLFTVEKPSYKQFSYSVKAKGTGNYVVGKFDQSTGYQVYDQLFYQQIKEGNNFDLKESFITEI
ncbi:hypothetical protein SS50377_27601 [Spironucleus salmonicida]|uniref:Uncharacterized protein n=1 Tax=Spironucleus salmonicida TaxID=348837 RepID=V6LSD8_9EUKA|nr:hypothetical protein SS50377_27601 [Spironucleus salmonicida]|eukprot:EST46621.1 Hypothetical protein SS50377_fx086 [Spironucleus salmonicida]